MRALARILVASLTVVAACGDDSTPTVADAGGDSDAPVIDAPIADAAPTACDYFTGTGCNLDAGEKCTATAEGPACGPAGSSPALAACGNDGECQAGTTCAWYGGVEQCLIFCDDGHPCPADPRQACFIRLIEEGNPDNVIAELCGAVCSLLAQDCPTAELGCYPAAAILDEAETGLCFNAGTGVQGAECAIANDCAAGFLCVDQSGGAANICAKLCDLPDGDPGCTDGLTCRELTGHTVTGACLP